MSGPTIHMVRPDGGGDLSSPKRRSPPHRRMRADGGGYPDWGTENYVRVQANGVAKDRGADRVADCLAIMPDTQAAELLGVEFLEHRISYLERTLDPALYL